MANKIPLAYADVRLQLATAISASDTSFTLSSATDDDGNSLPAGKYCFTIDNGSTNKEYLIGQLNGTSVTSVVSVSRQGVESSGAARPHRVGASVILSDFATIQRVADALRGVVDLDGSSPIGYDAEPTLSDRKDLATVGYVLDNVTGGAVTTETQTTTGTAGATISAGDLIYFKTSDQEWYPTDADDSATVSGVVVGIALGAGTDGVAITNGVLLQGIYTTSGLTAGSEYYASNTAGEYSTSPGTTQVKIGIALTATKLLKYPVDPAFENSIIQPGFITLYGGSSTPAGYLSCDGSAVSRTTYTSLFNVLSTSYGSGDGSTTFNLPDLRGAAVFGKGTRQYDYTFTDAEIDPNAVTVTRFETTGDYIQLTGDGNLSTGDQIVFAVSRGNISANTIYYLIDFGSVWQLATSYANAKAGTFINLTYDNASMSDTAYVPSLFSVTDPLPGDIVDGAEVTLTTDGTLPSNIPAGTYYLIRISDATFALTDTSAKGLAGDGALVNSSTAGTNVGSGTSYVTINGTTYTVGQTGGEESHKLTTAELAAHVHSVPGDQSGGGTGVLYDGAGTADSQDSASAGGDGFHENMPPYVIAHYIIKY